MKKILFIIGTIAIVVILVVGYVYYTKTIDTKFAIGFSEAFMNYDINDVDKYLSGDTLIICNGKNNTYEDLRANVISACNEKRYLFSKGSSYGYGSDKFIDGIQNINIKLYGKLNGQDIGECNISMRLRRKGLLRFKIETITCDAPIFESLFYANME